MTKDEHIVELEERIENLKSQIEKMKSNEWHYVKDGDLPKDENYVLVSNGKDWTKGFYKDKKWNIISLVGFTELIAWKEIVLPKEIE